ncbi:MULTISPECIES: hypothetical protein [unclassified Vibrio]
MLHPSFSNFHRRFRSFVCLTSCIQFLFGERPFIETALIP